ncbi:hypothetical protein BUALT_Bualt16G0103900 [Buddleja alternifolia]|uniref:Peptidase A1 domain-containing protein n=1 Tax=Buddleja alternifolia TaxID=168488 RepID=A0AAV6W8H1_9LAMI|nr:hypothetical protein BUALT_Bualt16G0103900 [Buddleja alternifolia]
MNMITTFSSNLLLFLFFFISFTTNVSVSRILLETEIPATSNLLVTALIHDNSVDSLNYDPHASLEDLSKVAYDSSQARASYLEKGSSFSPTDLETNVVPALQRGGFSANILVGSKRITQRVYLDTGSSLLWINCEPCGYNVPAEIFDPAHSDSYEAEPCANSSYCMTPLGAVKTYCDDRGNGKCKYEIRYKEGHNSKGHLARDDIKFSNSEEVLHKIVFGCARSTTLTTNGVLGLGNNRISLRDQSGYSKLSYCLGDLSDPHYEFNRLIIGGDKIKLRGAQTPVIEQNQYFINLEQIRIGGKVLDIDPEVLRRSPDDYTGGMAVDTGLTYSYFPIQVLETFEREIINAIDIADYYDEPDEKMRVCYRGNMNDDLNNELFPDVEFVFQDNAVMLLSSQNLFHQESIDKYCLGFLPSDTMPFSLLGNLMQQYFYVAIDLKAMKLAFERMECSSIDDKIRHDEL